MTAKLMRTNPFRELARFVQQVLGTASHPATMPMDARREAANKRPAANCLT